MRSTIRPVNWQFMLQVTILIPVTTYLLLFASTHNGVVDNTIIGITAGLFSVFAAFLLISGQRSRASVELPAVIFLVALVLATVFSIDPRRSANEIWLLGLAFVIFFMVAELIARGWSGSLFVTSALLVIGIIMALSWLETLTWYRQWLAVSPGNWIPDVAYRLPLPNFLGVMLNILLMMAITLLFQSPSRLIKGLLAIWILSALGMLYLTSSRGGWIGTAAGLACLATLGVKLAPETLKKTWGWLKSHRGLLAGGAVIGLIFIVAVGWLLYKQSIQPTHGSIVDSRSEFWGPASQAFISSPIVGKGPYTFISLYMGSNSVPPSDMYVYAHSIYMDLLSGSGLIGFLTFAWLAFVFLRTLWRRLCQVTGGEQALVVGCLAASAAFLVHGLFDSVHHTIPTVAWLAAILAGSAVGSKTGPVRRISLPIVLAILIAGLSWVNTWLGTPLQQGVQEANVGNYPAAANQLQVAVRRDPELAVSHQQLGLAESILASQGYGVALDRAVNEFEQTVRIDPYWGLNHANLGALYRAQGKLEAAREEFQQAVKCAPKVAVYYLNLGEVQEALGDSNAAAESYRQALNLDPSMGPSYFWRGSNLRRQVFSNWQAAQLQNSPEDIASALARLAENSSLAAAYPPVIEAAIKAGDLELAGKLLKQARLAYINKKVEALELDWWEADLAVKNDPQAAIQTAERALDGFRKQGIYGPGTFGTLMYDPLMFSRPAMAVDMVPQLTLINLPDRWGMRMAELESWYRQTGNTIRADAVHAELLKLIPDFHQQVKKDGSLED